MEQRRYCQEESGGGETMPSDAIRHSLTVRWCPGTWTGTGLSQYWVYLSEKLIIRVREDIVHLFQGTEVVHVYGVFFNGIS